MREVTPLHTTSKDRYRHRHFLLLLLPSLVFVFVLFMFIRNKWSEPQGKTLMSEVTQEIKTIKVGETQVNVTVARTVSEHEKGLSGVSDMGENEGMIFVFPSKVQPSFWMKGMLIPLDFIWISDGKVSEIMKDVQAPPLDTPERLLRLYIPASTVNYVLEVNSGFSDKNDIKVGDPVDLSSL